jgi:hypothetical protein
LVKELGRPVEAQGVPALADAAVSVVLCPAQMVELVGVMVGAGNTVTNTASLAEQPFVAPVTVYVVVVIAVNGELFVMPLFQV